MFTRNNSIKTGGMADPFATTTPSSAAGASSPSFSLSYGASSPSPAVSTGASSGLPSFLTSLDSSSHVYRSIDVMAPTLTSSDFGELGFTSMSRQSANNWDWSSESVQPQHKKLDFTSPIFSLPTTTVTAPAPVAPVRPPISCPALPAYVEPYSTFLSYSLPDQILSSLETALLQQRVEFQHNEGASKIKCTAYNKAASTCFNIYLYRGELPNSFAVEFQRRSGCVATFHSVYSRMTKCLGRVVIKPFNDNVSSPEYDVNCLPMPALGGVDSALNLEGGCIDILCDMVDSQDHNSAREALIMLANNNIDNDVVAQKESSLVKVLTYALSCRNEEIERCAALLLFKLASSRSLSSNNASSLISNAIALFEAASSTSDSDNSLYLFDTKRHLASSLAQLSYLFPSELGNHSDSLRRFRCDNDATVNTSITSCLNNIGVSC